MKTFFKQSIWLVKIPIESSKGDKGRRPNLDIEPKVGLKPMTPQLLAGSLTESPVSLPREKWANPVETTTADPLEDPPGSQLGFIGFFTLLK